MPLRTRNEGSLVWDNAARLERRRRRRRRWKEEEEEEEEKAILHV
jgi:hypothetical protein